LESRKDRNDENLWKSYDKLAKFYRTSKKDYSKAEENAKLVIEISKSKPRSGRYADALIQLATIYGDQFATDPAKSSGAEPLYKQALDIYTGHDWWSENLILFRLSKLYEKQQRAPEREQVLQKRVDTLARYFNQLRNPLGPQPKDPVTLVSEYLYAINALAYFYDGRNIAGAEAAYAQAVSAYDYIAQNIYNEKTIGFYADTLKDYKNFLNSDKVNKPAEGLQVAKKEKDMRDKLQQFDQIRQQQSTQQIKQGSATAP